MNMKLRPLSDCSKTCLYLLENAQLEPSVDGLRSQKLRSGLNPDLEHIELQLSGDSSKWLTVSFNLE